MSVVSLKLYAALSLSLRQLFSLDEEDMAPATASQAPEPPAGPVAHKGDRSPATPSNTSGPAATPKGKRGVFLFVRPLPALYGATEIPLG
jgi:hypothetical protein